MATNGQLQGNHINIGGNGGNFFFINWQLAGQSIENNHSTINWQAYFHYNNADAQLDNGIAALSGTRWHNGGRVKNFEARFVTRDVAVASGSFTIGHNGDGTQTLSVSGGIDVYQSGRSQGGTSWALPTIPRNSQVSTNATAYTLGDPITIHTNRKSGSFSHTVTIRQNNGSGTLLKTFNTVGDNVTWTPSPAEITTMEGLIPNSNTLTIFIDQYNNQVRANSSVTRSLTLTDANPTFSNFTFKDTSAATVAITGSDQVLVKGKSTLEVKVPSANKMVAIKSATPARYDFVYDGATEQKTYATGDVTQSFTPIASIGSRAIIVRAYDSRGNSTAVNKSVTVYDYVEPNIEIDVSRENNFGANVTIKTAGEFDLLNIGGANKNALTAASLQYRRKESTSSTWGAWTNIAFTVSGNEFTGTNAFISLDNTKSFDFEFRIADKFGTVVQTATLGAGVPLMFIGKNGTVEANGEALAKMSDLPQTEPDYSTSEVAMNVKWIDGKTVHRKVVNTGVLPNATSKLVAHGISNLYQVIRLYGWADTSATNATNVIALPFSSPGTASQYSLDLRVQGANVNLYTQADMRVWAYSYVIIEYTKTS